MVKLFLTVWEPGECVEDVASRRGRHLGLARMTSAEVLFLNVVSDCRGTVVQNLCDRGANRRLDFTSISGYFLLVRVMYL